MDTMTIEQMNKTKDELGLTYRKIAELSGVPFSTVQKVLGGITPSPRYSTVKALSDVLLYESRKNNPYATYHYSNYKYGEKPEKDKELVELVEEASPFFVHGSNAPLNKDYFTVEDYNNLGDDRRTELINGIFYDMATPTIEHQLIVGRIWAAFSNFIAKNKGNCLPVMAPFDVQIKDDDFNMVEPDVMIICDKNKLHKNFVVGAPDLVVEVVSKTSISHDKIRKLNLYYESKVREYWIVDPIENEILVYDFSESDFKKSSYTFEDKVPVNIYDNKLKIDFKEIRTYVENMIGNE